MIKVKFNIKINRYEISKRTRNDREHPDRKN